MSPAHLHQYVASISPGQLSESLPSSQVNICTCLPIHQKMQPKNAINEIQLNFNTHTRTHEHTNTQIHKKTNRKTQNTHKTQPPNVPPKQICTIRQSNSTFRLSNFLSLFLSFSIGFVPFGYFDVDFI